MKILVTGAAGSLGKALIEKLAALNDVSKLFSTHNSTTNEALTLYATDIKTNPFNELYPTLADGVNLTYKSFDLCSPKFSQWVEEIRPDQIVHLASILQISANITRRMAYNIDVLATEKLLETSVQLGVKKFIITTSGAAYGYYPENINEISEDRATKGNPDYFYSAHKADVEKIMASYRKFAPQLKQIVFRPGAILGPNFEGPIVDFFNQKIITGIIGYPSPFKFSWCEDVVDYLIEGLTSDITGEYNIAGDGTLSVEAIAQMLNKTYLPLPALLIQAALFIAKPLRLSQYGPEQVKFLKYRPVLNNAKIKKTFDHQPKFNSWQALTAYLASKNSEAS